MSVFWFIMMFASILVLLITNPSAVLSEMIGASASALSLCIELCAVYVVWLGILELVDASGLGEKLAKLLRPLIKKIFKIDNTETEKIIVSVLSILNIFLISGRRSFASFSPSPLASTNSKIPSQTT